jgi:lysozyme family protein
MENNYLNPDWVALAGSVAIDDDAQKKSIIVSLCKQIKDNFGRYQYVSAATGVPAMLIAAIHYREASFNFNCMLHNGEPLTIVSRIVPVGVGPFATWENSAIDALVREGCVEIENWEMSECLKFAESYNGKGYRKKGMYSPYVFSFTNLSDELGGYPSDGKFSNDYVHKRPGVAALMLGMIGEAE